MKLDFEDIFTGAVGGLFIWLGSLLGALWVGLTLAEFGDLARDFADGWSISARRISALAGFLPVWSILGLFVLPASYWKLIRMEGSAILWGLIVAIAGIASMGSRTGRASHDEFAFIVGWVTFVLLMVMLGTCLWFCRQWQTNRWAGEMAMLKSENAMRRAELKEDFGTDSVGQDEVD